MKKRKMLAAVVCLSMAASMLLGCGGSSAGSSSAAPAAQTTAETEANSDSDSAEASASNDIEERHFVITGGYNDVHGYNADAQAYIKLLVDSSDGKIHI